MEITFNSSVIFTKNLEKSKKFYTTILKQEVELDFGKCIILKCGLSLWEVPEKHRLKNSIKSNNPNSYPFEVCFETDNIEAIDHLAKFNEIKYLHSVVEESWGQQTIRILDPDNNIIEIGEKLDVFVKRLFNNGLTAEQTAEKTSVPIDKVKEIIKA